MPPAEPLGRGRHARRRRGRTPGRAAPRRAGRPPADRSAPRTPSAPPPAPPRGPLRAARGARPGPQQRPRRHLQPYRCCRRRRGRRQTRGAASPSRARPPAWPAARPYPLACSASSSLSPSMPQVSWSSSSRLCWLAADSLSSAITGEGGRGGGGGAYERNRGARADAVRRSSL